ncbi:MAG: ATP-dependent DNA helicase RecG, partial [Alphaproteobacteria bacterium HGW-Alphaproteobacteria-11]
DSGDVSGLNRSNGDAEEWVMNICRNNIRPPVIPFWEVVSMDDGKTVGVITLPADSPDKPYEAKQGSAWIVFIRVGTVTREASKEEKIRLYQASGQLHNDIRPVPGSSLADLDIRRLQNYFRDIRQQDCPASEDSGNWEKLLTNTEFMILDRGRMMATVGGMLLFGVRPNRYLPQSGISAVAYPGQEKDYATQERAVLRGPIVALRSTAGDLVEAGLVEQAIDFVRRNTQMKAQIGTDGRREERWDYPLEAVREAIVNAIAHRDYTIGGIDIELSLYADRIEVISPGNLPNTVTVEKMRLGYRATRNELIKEVLRDYRYIEASGLGVPRKIIRGMKEHNGTEPDLIEEESRFTVRLWKEPRPT